jgi:EpsI family protein
MAGVFFLLFAAYSRVFYYLINIWATRNDYAHGFLILPISFYLVWVKRETLRNLPFSPMPIPGLAIVFLSGMLLLIGEAGEIITLGGISFIGMLFGLVLLLFGVAYLRVLCLPIFYLLFMIPILDEVLTPLQWPFQLTTAKMAVAMLQKLGFSALVEKNYIVLPNIILEVATVCSGVAYLVSIVAIGLPLGYLFLSAWWSRGILLLFAITIGILSNWLRVFLIGISAYWGGEVHGPYHIFQGMFVAWMGFGALFTGVWGLSKIDRPVGPDPLPPHERTLPLGRTSPIKSDWDRSWAIALFSLFLLSALMISYERNPIDLRNDLSTIPTFAEGWIGTAAALEEADFRIEGADAELFRRYRSPSGRTIHLYIAYLKLQEQGKEIVNYKTAPLHQGAVETSVWVAPEISIPVNVGQIEDPRRRILFWYDLNGRVVTDRYRAKLFGIVDALLHRRTNGALVFISQDPGGEVDSLQGEEEAFIRALYPRLRESLP